MSQKEPTAFGIDLGTTCSAIGHIVDGRPELIPIDGDVLVPSVVRFGAGGAPEAVGIAAENEEALHPEATLRSTKRDIGTERTWSIAGTEVSPMDAAAAILEHLANGAEAATGTRPKAVVISVPAWFNHSARADTRAAAERAGLEVVRLINEPTAAALAREFQDEAESKLLVFDLGGGTFDASLVDQRGAFVEVLASHGDTRLGGDDVDAALVELAVERTPEESFQIALRKGIAPRLAALSAIRDAKHALSSDLTATARAPFIAEVDGDSRHLECVFDRSDVDGVMAPLLERAVACVEEVLDAAGVTPDEVDDALLVGGMTRAPAVRSALEAAFGWEGDGSMPAQTAVALGATIQAGLAAGLGVQRALVDVTPHALSVTAATEAPDGTEHMIASTITPRNDPLPSRRTHRFWTMTPTQSVVRVLVQQGSDPNPLRNVSLTEARLDGIPPGPDGPRPLSIQLRQSLDGVVSISIEDELSGLSADAPVALSGAESEQLRQELLEDLERSKLIPGPPGDPDPFGAAPEFAVELEPFAPAPAGGPDGDQAAAQIEDARTAFEQVAANMETLEAAHPGQSLALRGLVSRGQSALGEGRDADAIEAYDALGDLMFEQGIYL